MKVYVASSWRNPRQLDVVAMLRQAGHEVYDYRHPNVEGPGAAPKAGFGWEEIAGGWQTWTPKQFIEALEHPIAEEGFSADWSAMQWADAFVLVMPCGRSAHLEAGWAIGAGKPTAISFEPDEPFEAELMYKMADLITDDSRAILTWLAAGCSGTATSDTPTLLDKPLSTLGLPERWHLALCRGIKRGPDPMLGELLAHDVTEIRDFRGVGAGCLDRLVAELDRRGLHLRPGAE